MYLKKYWGRYSCPIHILSCSKHIISGSYHKCICTRCFFFSFQAENKKQNLYPVYKNDDEYDPGNYRPMSLLSIFSGFIIVLFRAYNHGQKLLTHENYQHFSLV